jgi:hypothetical protein
VIAIKILKLIKTDYGHYHAVFDSIPEMTYEKIGSDYIGSAVDDDGEIIFSRYLKREPFGNAFGGSELTLNMKDGSVHKIKDYWFDHGSYKKHGEFISIGAGTVEKLQDCYVYRGCNINKKTFENMVDEYLTRDKIHGYDDVEEWCKLQHKWYDVVISGKKIPYMMNKYGDMVDKWTKKGAYPRRNQLKKVNGEYKQYTYFKFKYHDGDKPIRIEASYLDVLKNTLPFTTEEIIVNCKLPADNT